MEPHQKREDWFSRTAVSLESLQKGTEIVLDSGDPDGSSDDEPFDENAFQSFKAELEKVCTGDDDVNLDLSSFEVLREKMQPITDDGLIKKLELKPGYGPIIPTKSLVLIHYNSYFEKQTVPFDSSYQRNSPVRFLLGNGRVVPVLEVAVATMKKGEVSSFLVHHDYAFGPMGCPPRIPPCATLYLEVEVLNYVDSGDAIEFELLTEEEQRRAPFGKILSACKAEHQMGNDLFKKKMLGSAAARYRKAVNMLEDTHVADENEDNKRQSLLLKLYTNLAVCYGKLKNAKKTRINAQKVLKLDPESTKALFYLGKSCILDAEYDEALKYLYQAQKIHPYDEAVNKEISLTEKRQKQSEEKEKIFCENIFGGRKKTDDYFNEPKEFVDTIKECVKKFKESSEREYSLSSGFTPSQVEDIKTVATLNSVQFIEKIHDGDKICKLCK